MAPHAVCLLWRKDLLALHGISDALIAVSYFAIPLLIIKGVKIRPDLIDRRVALLFSLFIVACGITHLAGLITLWYPYYGWQALVKLLTAVISLATAFILWRLWPELMQMPSSAQLATVEAQRIAQDEVVEATERSNSKLQDFANMAAHDLKAPLVNLGTIPALIKEELDSPEINRKDLHDYADMMTTQVQRMSSLITDLLSYSKIGTGNQGKEVIDSSEVMAQVVAFVDVPENFAIDVSEDLPQVTANRAEFELIMRNLLSNALSHHDQSAGNISVSGTLSGDGLWGVFDITDDGPGIPDDYKEAIFDRFFRIKGATRKCGSGLGLAAVARAIDEAGGNIEVHDNPATRGATFRVSLPRTASNDSTEDVLMAERPRNLSANLVRQFDGANAPAKQLCVLIGQLATILRTRNVRLLSEAGYKLSRDELVTLTGLRLSPEPHALSAQALSGKAQMTSAGITKICESLIMRWLIERTDSNAGDSEAVYKLTSRGIELTDRAIPIVHGTEIYATRTLGNDEIKSTCNILERMTSSMQSHLKSISKTD